MRAFNLTTPTTNASYENAIQAGSLSHTGNSIRPVGGPVKWIQNPGQFLPGNAPTPRGNPVHPVQGSNGATVTTVATPHGIVSRPVAHVPLYRGSLGS